VEGAELPVLTEAPHLVEVRTPFEVVSQKAQNLLAVAEGLEINLRLDCLTWF